MAINMCIPYLDENNIKQFYLELSLISAKEICIYQPYILKAIAEGSTGANIGIGVTIREWDCGVMSNTKEDSYTGNFYCTVLDNKLVEVSKYLSPIIDKSPVPEIPIAQINIFVNDKLRYFIKHLTQKEISLVIAAQNAKKNNCVNKRTIKHKIEELISDLNNLMKELNED